MDAREELELLREITVVSMMANKAAHHAANLLLKVLSKTLESMDAAEATETAETAVGLAAEPDVSQESSPEGGAVPLGATLPEDCPHPEHRRQEAHSMGHPDRFICRECGATVG
jgi:hypothetical protein